MNLVTVFFHPEITLKPIDIFHPLTTLNWEEHASIPGQVNDDVQCVYLNGKLHVGGVAEEETEDGIKYNARLYISSPDLSSWTYVTTPTSYFGLTTWHSQIVLVGGMEDIEIESLTNELWLSADGMEWKRILPPMSTARFTPLAINAGTTESIAVIGGVSEPNPRKVKPNFVDVYIDGQWTSVEPIPLRCVHLFSTLHNGNWFVRGRNLELSDFVYCKVESLISAARSTIKDTPSQGQLWKQSPIALFDILAPVSFHDELLVVEKFFDKAGKIYALSPCAKSWVHVGDTPIQHRGDLRSPKLLIMDKSYPMSGSFSSDTEVKVYKAVVQASAFDYDSPFTMSTLSKLEEKGFPIVSALDKVYAEFAATTGVTLSEDLESTLQMLEAMTGISVRGMHMQDVVSQWLSEKSPTWRTLLEVLKKLNLEELGHEIEKYLNVSSGIKSLTEMCMSVIMSALLQQRSLEPDKLHERRLPDYISPRDKQSISDRLKALAHPQSSPLPKYYSHDS